MNWRGTARWIIAAIGVGTAVAIVAYTRRRPEPPPRPPVLAKIDRNATLQGGAGETEYLRAGKSPINQTHGRVTSYDDGHARFEDVVIRGLEESRFTVRAKVSETSPPVPGTERPSRMNLSGGVKVTTDDGLDLVSDTAVWDDAANQLTMPGPVTFTKGRVSGTGLGATYDRVLDAFTLLDRAQAHVSADATGKGSADLTSTRMTLVRGKHIVELEQNAKIVGETQTLTSRDATVSFTEDESAVKYLELRDTARVTPNPGSTGNRPAMNADRITMSFYEDGVTLQHATLTGQAVLDLNGEAPRTVRASWIDLNLAPDGQTLTGLNAKDRVSVVLAATAATPGRTISSSVLTALGDPKKGLTSARFDGSPRFEETELAAPQRGVPVPAKPARWGTSVVLVLTLGGQIDAIELAEFQQNAQFHDGDVTGEADTARYQEANGKLHLLPSAREPRRRSHVSTPDMQVDATTIDVDTETNDLQAVGAVVTRSKQSAGTAPPGALFDGDGPIIGSAETLNYTKDSGTAIYTGTPVAQARLKQGSSVVVGNRIEYSDSTQNLNASGNVDSTWFLESGPAGSGGQLKSQRVRADTMAYDEAARTAIYKGAPVRVITQDGNDIEGRTVTFLLADASRELKSMRAQSMVWATLSGGYEAVGDVLVYDAKTEIYTLEGQPKVETARVKSPRSDSPAANPMCNLNDGMQLVLNRKTGEVTVPGEGQAPRNVEQVPCSMTLRRTK